MGRLELPIPELGDGLKSLEEMAEEMEKRIRAQAPRELRGSISVKPFRKQGETGLAIEYDDRAERYVYIAIEYPAGSGKEECAAPDETRRC